MKTFLMSKGLVLWVVLLAVIFIVTPVLPAIILYLLSFIGGFVLQWHLIKTDGYRESFLEWFKGE